MTADLQRSRIRHRPAHTQRYAVIDEMTRLHVAAVKRMGDARGRCMATQILQHHVLGAAHVQQHRQAEFCRQRQLCGVKMLLPRPRRAACGLRHKKIQPDFPHRDKTRVGERRDYGRAQSRQIVVMGLGDIHRMDTQRISTARNRMRQVAHGRKVMASYRRNHDARHARGLRDVRHRHTVGIELGSIQMAVRVDQHGHQSCQMPSRFIHQLPGAHQQAPVGQRRQLMVVGDDDEGCA